MDSTRSRLFFALLPDPVIREKVALVSHEVRCPDARRVIPENYHLTLLFLGAIAGSERNQLCQESSGIHAAPFSVRIDHSGWWRRPKVFWIGPAVIPDPLMALHRQLCELAQSRQLLDDVPSFRPHITLMRKVRAPVTLPTFPPICWDVDRFCLMESISSPDGVRYRVVEEWPLRPGQVAARGSGHPEAP